MATVSHLAQSQKYSEMMRILLHLLQGFINIAESSAASGPETVRLGSFCDMLSVLPKYALSARIVICEPPSLRHDFTSCHEQLAHAGGSEVEEDLLMRDPSLEHWHYHPGGALAELSFSVMISFPGFDPRQVSCHIHLAWTCICAGNCGFADWLGEHHCSELQILGNCSEVL